jgi:hypothetical protein
MYKKLPSFDWSKKEKPHIPSVCSELASFGGSSFKKMKVQSMRKGKWK